MISELVKILPDQIFADSRSQITVIAPVIKMLNMPFVNLLFFFYKSNNDHDFEFCFKTNKVNK